MPLRESTNVLENGQKKKRARTQVEKSERNAKKYPVAPCKESCSKWCVTNFSRDDRALIISRFWKFSFTERRQWLLAYINQVDAKNVQEHKSKNQKRMPKNTLWHRVKNHAANGVLPTFPEMIEP